MDWSKDVNSVDSSTLQWTLNNLLKPVTSVPVGEFKHFLSEYAMQNLDEFFADSFISALNKPEKSQVQIVKELAKLIKTGVIK